MFQFKPVISALRRLKQDSQFMLQVNLHNCIMLGLVVYGTSHNFRKLSIKWQAPVRIPVTSDLGSITYSLGSLGKLLDLSSRLWFTTKQKEADGEQDTVYSIQSSWGTTPLTSHGCLSARLPLLRVCSVPSVEGQHTVACKAHWRLHESGDAFKSENRVGMTHQGS